MNRLIFKEHWEILLGAIVTVITISLSLIWLFANFQAAEPILEVTQALVTFLVFLVSFKAIMSRYDKNTFAQEFNIQMKKFWTEFGALIRESGEHDGVIDFTDSEANVLEISKDTNSILKKDIPAQSADYYELVVIPDEFAEGSEIIYYVNSHHFEKRARVENTDPLQLARLVGASVAYKVNENYASHFAAESTDFDGHRAIVTIKLKKKMKSAADAKEIVYLLRYLIVLQLALD
ncbi:MAG: hypothetical protein LBV19_05810 [Streptococcaceae bacterium]|jgi:hypothetical protein|nr:hypothetical protein [Streptococcaceae bacterium]